MKRFVACFLVFVIIACMLPVQSYSAYGKEAQSVISDNAGFPDYVTVFPKGTPFSFSPDEKNITFPATYTFASDGSVASDLAVGDVFAVYVGDVPVAYTAQKVATDAEGTSVEVAQAPAAVYNHVNVDTALDLSDGMVAIDTKDGVTAAVYNNDSIALQSNLEGEASTEGTLTVTLSNFHIQSGEDGAYRVSVNYELKTEGKFEANFEKELGKIRFLGIGTFSLSFVFKANAELTFTSSGTLEFSKKAQEDGQGTITSPSITNANVVKGEGEVRASLKVAVGIDVFVVDSTVWTASAGIAGKISNPVIEEPGIETHQHLAMHFYGFITSGLVKLEGEIDSPQLTIVVCDHDCGSIPEDKTFTFKAAIGDEDLFSFNTEAIQELLAAMRTLSRMLCGDQTVRENLTLSGCSIESGSDLTIAEGVTVTVNGNMEQRGGIKLDHGASLIVHGDYLHEGGELVLGEDSTMTVDGKYTMKDDLHETLNGGAVTFTCTVKGDVKVKDDDDDTDREWEGSLSKEKNLKVTLFEVTRTKMTLYEGSNLVIGGDMIQNGGDISHYSTSGENPKAYNISVGAAAANGEARYLQTGGTLTLDRCYKVLINGDYIFNGGEIYLSDNPFGEKPSFEITNHYIQDGSIKTCTATWAEDVQVGGDFTLTAGTVNQWDSELTVGGDFTQSGESNYKATLNSTLRFTSGQLHTISFEHAEESCLGTIICENPTDKIDAKTAMPGFSLGSDIEITGDLRLVDDTSYNCRMYFNDYTLTVDGCLNQEGVTMGNGTGTWEPVHLKVGCDYVLAGGTFLANGGTIEIDGSFIMEGYDAINDTREGYSQGGFLVENATMTVEGSIVLYCNVTDGLHRFSFTNTTHDAKLTIMGNLIQHQSLGDEDIPTVELRCNLIFGRINQEQNVVFAQKPKTEGTTVCLLAPELVNWGDNTDELKSAVGHNFEVTKVQPATTIANGATIETCTYCGTECSTPIYKIASAKLSSTKYTYSGSAKSPTLTIKDSAGNRLVKGEDYTYTRSSGRKNVGKYNYKVTFKGKYSGTETLYFIINPKETSISALTATKAGFKVSWRKQSTQTTGYQIRYSTSSKMSSAKTVTISKNTTLSKSVSKLKSKKRYYVQVRTYKNVNGTKYYSGWSNKKSVVAK